MLSALIETNDRRFNISEIEGDAILFYKYERSPYYEDIVAFLLNMKEAFNKKILELNEALNTQIQMSLKFIVHYGKFSRYYIKSFKKLYGQPIVEAHQLLKNVYTRSSSYVLFSSSFLEAVKDAYCTINRNNNYVPQVSLIHYL